MNTNFPVNAVIPFSNHFGKLEMTVMSGPMAIKDISFDKCKVVRDNTFSLDDAEKIALITENKSIQIGFCTHDYELGYVVLHDGPSTGYLCRANIIDFVLDDDITPAQQINTMAKYQSLKSMHAGC